MKELQYDKYTVLMKRIIVLASVLLSVFSSSATVSEDPPINQIPTNGQFIVDRLSQNRTEWPEDGALVVLGGCLYGPGPGCDEVVADVEVLAAPDSLPENCTKPPPFPLTSFNHGTVFFNNTLLTCGGMALRTECLTWTPGSTHWNPGEHFLTRMMRKPYSVVTSAGAWFLDFGDEVSNILTLSNTDGRFQEGPNPSMKPRMNPCITTHSDSDSIMVIGGFMYGDNSDVEMYTAEMVFWRYLPELKEARQSHSCGSAGDYLVVAGGRTLEETVTDTVEVLNLASNEGWVFFPSLTNKMFDGVMANLFGSLIIIGGTEDVISNNYLDFLQEKEKRSHNTSISNNIILEHPFEYSTNVGIMTTRELGHTVVPIKISQLCYLT